MLGRGNRISPRKKSIKRIHADTQRSEKLTFQLQDSNTHISIMADHLDEPPQKKAKTDASSEYRSVVDDNDRSEDEI